MNKMRKLTISVLLTISLFTMSLAQSGRQITTNILSPETMAIKELTPKEMFTQAKNYVLDEVTKLQAKKVPYDEKLHQKIVQDQKLLAAKYASEVTSRENIGGEDYYYLGRLHWLATNADDSAKAFKKFLDIRSGSETMRQSARSVVTIIFAKNKNFVTAKNALTEYRKNQPIRTAELITMLKQMTHSYQLESKFELAAPFADDWFKSAKILLFEKTSRARSLNELLYSGIAVFEVQKKLGNHVKAIETLESMRKYAVNVKSHSVYYKAVDERIRYLIDINKKAQALEFYKTSLKQVEKDFEEKSLRNYVKRKLQKRKPHYKILGETAPALTSIDRWLPNKPETLESMRGKVILLDFWATWCGPCLAAFPSLIDWHKEFKDDGLVILGVTRYYGQSDDGKPSDSKEFKFLQDFKVEFKLPYRFVVANSQANQITYGAKSIPTAVLIDRKGIVRFVESGTGETREKEIHKKILELLAEEQ